MQKKSELDKFLEHLKGNKNKMSQQEYRTIRGQALMGNVMDARKGMQRVVRRRSG